MIKTRLLTASEPNFLTITVNKFIADHPEYEITSIQFMPRESYDMHYMCYLVYKTKGDTMSKGN